jgi:hypothetical protein
MVVVAGLKNDLYIVTNNDCNRRHFFKILLVTSFFPQLYVVILLKYLCICYAVLASWFRLKYPHLAIGALASSAPILFMDDMIQPNAFMDAVSKDFKVIYLPYYTFSFCLNMIFATLCC